MTTWAQKEAMERYLASAKGQAAKRRAQDRYNHTAKGRMARANYMKSCKGKEAVAASRKRARLLN